MAGASRATLWSLRPAGEHAGLRRVAQGAGFRLRVLPLQRLVARPASSALSAACAASVCIVTSPAAVRFAARQGGLRSAHRVVAVGAGTAAALHATGVAEVAVPARMDSEGVLALPELESIEGRAVGLVTAPNGRGLLEQGLLARGARLVRADVYARWPLHGGARSLAALADDDHALLLVTSAEALGLLVSRLGRLAPARSTALCRHRVIAGSARLAEQARRAGFPDVIEAAGPTPAALVDAARAVPPYNHEAASGRAPL